MTGVKAASVKPVRVFISYSHDSPEHMEHVLAFANNLRAHGIDSVVDRYFEDTLNMRWADWMNQQIEAADFVLVVATPSYSQRLKPADAGSPGAGANFEAAIITQHLYNLHGHNDKFFAIYFGDANRTSIPTVLEGFPNYDVSTDNGYTKLYRRLTNQPGFVPPPLGAVIDPALLYSPPVPPPVASPHQQAAKDRVEELGRAYQNLRKSMPASNERTRKMEILAARMRALACDAYFLLEYLAKNPETGSRLAAISLLETKPNPDYLEWLSERFAVEKPFVGYHAALALLVAARALGAEFRQRTKTAIDEANRLLGSGLETTDRAQTLTSLAANYMRQKKSFASSRFQINSSPDALRNRPQHQRASSTSSGQQRREREQSRVDEQRNNWYCRDSPQKRVNAATRRRIAAAQRKRWADFHKKQKKTAYESLYTSLDIGWTMDQPGLRFGHLVLRGGFPVLSTAPRPRVPRGGERGRPRRRA